jgi:hypothetical protein
MAADTAIAAVHGILMINEQPVTCGDDISRVWRQSTRVSTGVGED